MRVSRRRFLASSAVMSAAGFWSNLEKAAAETPLPHALMHGKIPLKILATNWGFAGTFDEFCRRAKADGYDGFEVWLPLDEATLSGMLESAARHGLAFGLLFGASEPQFERHAETYEKAVRLAAAQKPLYVNTHAGRDFFSFEQNKKILETGVAIARDTGVPVFCETHRGRCAYAAPLTRQYLDALPDLRLTADFSHWCVVHEGLLSGFEDALELAIARADHIHARVGHAEGPQVNDPRAPEWEKAVQIHLGWWDRIVAYALQRGKPFQTFLTEFGPPHYLPALPYTQQPVANQWDINVHMMKILRERYG